MSYKKYGKGWFNESKRHSLARKGIKTGRKSQYTPATLMGLTVEHRKDIKKHVPDYSKQRENKKLERKKFEVMEQLGYDVIFGGVGGMAGAGFGPVGIAIGIPAGVTLSHAIKKYGIPNLNKFVEWKAKKKLKRLQEKRKINYAKESSKLTDEDLQKIDEMYNYDIPKYLKIVNKNKIKIRAEQYEGAGYKWIEITPKDVVKYYHGPARNITSGIRTLSTFSTDWRMVDNMAKESLEIFKIINREALEKEGKKYGMSLR